MERHPFGLFHLPEVFPLTLLNIHSFTVNVKKMKNITVSVNDDIYHRARIKAAEKKSSVSRLVAEYLEKLVEEDDRLDKAREEMTLLFERNAGGEYRVKMSREEMHDE